MKFGRGKEAAPSNERIEPKIGATSERNVAARYPRSSSDNAEGSTRQSRERVSVKESVVESTAPRDVLMDSSRSRYVTTDVPVARPDAAIRRERGYEKASPHGRRIKREAQMSRWQWNFAWLNRRLALIVFVIGVMAAIYWVSEPIARLFERPIKSVVVEGEFNFITKEHATELLSNEINGDFLQLDLMQLKNALLNDPWVEKVTLNRRWPDTLVVKILEQKPIARWGDGFLNQRGEIVRVDEIDRLLDLPWLQGNESDAIEILQQYQDLSQLLRSRGLEVVALKCDNKKSWRLTIKNRVEIAIGRDQVMEKMRRFVTVYDTHLHHVWQDVNAIDIRYSNGVAVRWVADSEMAKKFIKSQILPNANVPNASAPNTGASNLVAPKTAAPKQIL